MHLIGILSFVGIAGLQWKKQLGDIVHVVLAEKESDDVKESCSFNNIDAQDWELDPKHEVGEWPAVVQGVSQVHVCPYSAQTALHQEAFNFV